MPRLRLHIPLNPYRLFHLSARLRLHDGSPPPTHNTPQSPNNTFSSSSSSSAEDDYYALLLSSPLPSAAPAQKPPPTTLSPTAPSSKVPPTTTIQTTTTPPSPSITFAKALSGPSPRVRGLERAEQGLERPKEPDNCCMSGCVNCVWDAYREEVETWAEKRRGRGVAIATAEDGREGRREVRDGGVGELDEVGGMGRLDGEGEEDVWGEVPVGIREFMRTEKRLRERRVGG